MARTWADTRRRAAPARRRRSTTSPAARWRVAVTGQGDGTWLIDARRRAGRRRLALARQPRRRAGRARCARDGTGDAARTRHRHRPQRLPAGAAAASGCSATRPGAASRAPPPPSTARTGSTSTSPASAPPTPPKASSPSATSAPAPTRPRCSRPWAFRSCAACCRRCVDGSARPSPADRRPPPRRPACSPARPSCSAISTSSAPALGGGLYDPVRSVGCTVIGSTGMHMRLARGLDDVQPQRRADRLHDARSRCPAAGRRCSRTWRRRSTSTGWSTCAVEVAGGRRERRWSAASCWPLIDARVADARARPAAVPSLHLRGRRARSVRRPAGPRPVPRPVDQRTGFFDLARAVYEGLWPSPRATATPPWATRPDEIRITGGAARSGHPAPHPRHRARRADPHQQRARRRVPPVPP